MVSSICLGLHRVSSLQQLLVPTWNDCQVFWRTLALFYGFSWIARHGSGIVEPICDVGIDGIDVLDSGRFLLGLWPGLGAWDLSREGLHRPFFIRCLGPRYWLCGLAICAFGRLQDLKDVVSNYHYP